MTDVDEVREGARIFRSRFVDKIKTAKVGVRFKSSLVIQNYGVIDAAHITKRAPTIRCLTDRPILTLAACHDEISVHTGESYQRTHNPELR